MEFIKILVSGGLITGVISLIIFLFPNYGLKRKNKIDINTEQAKERINAIKKVIELEKKADVIEDVNLAHPELFMVERIEFGKDPPIYMSILENRDSLNNFWNELSEIRRNEDTWLSQKVSAYLLYAEKYIIEFIKFLKFIEYTENDLYIFGLLLAPDIQKWQRELDAILIKELNNVSFEMESHSGDEWKYEKETLEERYTHTILFGLVNKINIEAMRLMCCIIVNYSCNTESNNEIMNLVAKRLMEEGYLDEN